MVAIDRAALKAEIVRERGYWARFHDVLLEHAPGFLKAYVGFQAAPTRSKILDQKLCEFIYIAVDVSVNHLYERGAWRHMEYALKAGASKEELLQVVLLTTVVAAHHPIDTGIRILMEEIGAPDNEPKLTEAQQALKKSYMEATGYWPEGGDFLLARSSGSAEAYMEYGTSTWAVGPLSRHDKELIALAVCAAPTTLFEPGMRRHIRGALAAGASAEEISMVLQLAAAVSVHTCTIAIPRWEDVLNGKFLE
jgi:alkylhydroperoxidase/carboxymuconolactone decarboxylase family protein YurZ